MGISVWKYLRVVLYRQRDAKHKILLTRNLQLMAYEAKTSQCTCRVLLDGVESVMLEVQEVEKKRLISACQEYVPVLLHTSI